MTKIDFTRTVVAVVCTMVMSATCFLGALTPATAGLDNPVAAARQLA